MHIVGERDAAPSRTVVRDPHVGGELFPTPEDEDHSVSLEEGRLLHFERRPPSERFIERLRPRIVRNAEGHEAYALLHTRTLPLRVQCRTVPRWEWTSSSGRGGAHRRAVDFGRALLEDPVAFCRGAVCAFCILVRIASGQSILTICPTSL